MNSDEEDEEDEADGSRMEEVKDITGLPLSNLIIFKQNGTTGSLLFLKKKTGKFNAIHVRWLQT